MLHLLGEKMETRTKNTDNLLDNSQEADVYVEKTRRKFMFSE